VKSIAVPLRAAALASHDADPSCFPVFTPNGAENSLLSDIRERHAKRLKSLA
jgi:hypothetical protein